MSICRRTNGSKESNVERKGRQELETVQQSERKTKKEFSSCEMERGKKG